MKNDEKKNGIQKLAERLYDPLQFRIFVTAVMLLVGYAAVYTPLSKRITETTQKLKKAKQHRRLIDDINGLEDQIDRVAARLPENADTNEWVQYILGGIRELPLKLNNLDSDDPRRVGPFQAVVLRLELRGDYRGIESFLDWIETNERLFRIDDMRIAVARSGDYLEMRLTLLGLQE